jgi:hypothetical protein
MITDGPTDQFERILITLDRMLLLGGSGGHQVLYDGPPITFDLLDLGDRADFAFSSLVLADDYSKIRLKVSKIELVDIGPMDPTAPAAIELVDLPANGKIDLNPQGPFTVLAGQTTVVELDMHANRSFQVVVTGNGGYKLRPVIFVNVYPGDINLPSKLIRVFGTVNAVSDAEKSVVLCNLQFVAQLGAVTTGDADDCVRLFANGSTSIFGDGGLAIGFQDIAMDNELTGIGFLTPDGADVLFSLDAVVMEVGEHQPPSDTGWETLRGMVVSPQADCDGDPGPQCFDFKPFDSDTPIKTRLQPATRVFDSRGTELTQTGISDTDSGSVDGLRVINGTEELLAALVVLSVDVGENLVSGLLTAVSAGTSYDILTVDRVTMVCVNEETDVLRILVDDEIVTIVDLLDPAVLEEGVDMIEAAGALAEADMPECDIVADVVIVE